MYIRTISRKNKDGSTVTYVQLAHNERTSGKGHPKARILYNFGRIDSLDIEQLKRLVKSISRFLPPEEALETQAQLKYRGKTLRWSSCRSFGGSYLLSALWQKLNFHKLLEKLLASREFATPIAQAIFAMVANRCLAPASKLAISEWVQKDIYIPDLTEVDVQILYRAMDFLLLHQAKLEQEIYWAVADLLNLEVDLLFFDTSSTYFETEEETDLKKRGYSKDKRADLPQVVIGLAVTRDGIPVKHWVFSGNTVDMSTIETVKKDLSSWRLNRCVLVHDTGMTSEANLHYLQRGGGHYIVGRKMKSGEKDVQQALGHKGPYTQIQDDLWAKEVLVGDGEKRKRLILVKNTREQERAESARQKLLECLEKKLTALNERKNTSHNKAVCELKSHPVYGKYVKELKSGKLSLKRTKLSQESRYDGKFLAARSALADGDQ